MKKLLTVSVLAITIAACGSGEKWAPPAPPEPDPAVAAQLPTGSYTVRGEFFSGEEIVANLEGLVNFGYGGDGEECEAVYVLTVANPAPGELAVVRAIRQKGGPSWYQEMVNPNDPGPWYDNFDPEAPARPEPFVPGALSSAMRGGIVPGAGDGALCSIKTMARYMTASTGRMMFDPARLEAAGAAGAGEWVRGAVDAAGVSGGQRNRSAEELFAASVPELSALVEGVEIGIVYSYAGAFEVIQYRNGEIAAVIGFRPSVEHYIEAPKLETFFGQISQTAASEGPEAALARLGIE